ncbi:MAG TPA: 16S rRNA (cytosine(1402)-N(4))-methyltransferase RsmH [Thermoanaerobaculia bacterium]|jgi:16S rRNA (cytosine1402-N4)-methyltransferase|nr:16S rRNA (cytosine(1402)-N(4))-methyltransferase RsmH [Thermoanaerobaculia bacterium]
MAAQHVPVLVAETLDLLAPERRPGGWFVDATVGLGGHAEALLTRAPEARLLGLDRDPQALERAAERLAPFADRVRFEHANFHELEAVLARLGGFDEGVSGVLADLGVSSLQLDTAERGFSFRFDGPLDMRMGLADVTAADLVNQSSEEELERIFRDYGEELQARRIARTIVRMRAAAPVTTTGQLRELIGRAKGGRKPWEREGRVDPATRVFQALRIAVNQELAGLEGFLEQAVRLLEDDGRLVVISYHSLEDRIVKNTLRDLARGDIDQVTGRPRSESQLIEVLTKKPLRPSEEEVAFNPRSRSARLRAAKRI